MADKEHKHGESGAPEPGEVTEVTQASSPAEAGTTAVDEESTAVVTPADDEVTQVAAAGGGDDEVTAVAASPRRPSRLRAPPHRPPDRPLAAWAW